MASQDGATALIKASLHGHKDTVELLVTYGADVEAECLVRLQLSLSMQGRPCGNDGSSCVAVLWSLVKLKFGNVCPLGMLFALARRAPSLTW